MAGGNPLAALVVAKALAGERDERPEAPRRPRPPLFARLRRSARVPDTGCVFLAEHYLSDPSDAGVAALTRRLEAAAAAARSEGRDVRFLGFAALPGDESLLSVVAAPCCEAAERTVERADVAADRIVPVLWRPAHD